MSRSQPLKDRHANWEVSEGLSSNPTKKFSMNIQPSDALDGDRNGKRCLPQFSPEDISLYYKDTQGVIQGPFNGSNLIRWFEAGFFGIDLEVRLEGASHDTPFLSLGEVFPKLRAKTRPPPGFGVPKKCETAESLSGSNVNGLEKKAHEGSSGINISWNEPRNEQESSREADSKMLESLISSGLSCSLLEKLALSEGLPGYAENSSFRNLLKGVENGNEQQQFFLKQQQDLPNSRILEAICSSQNVNLVSILQGLDPDFCTKTVDWSRSLGQGGFCTSQYMMNSHDSQHIHSQPAHGVQEQTLQAQNQPFGNTVGQYVDRSYSATSDTINQLLLLEQQQKILQLLQQLLLQQPLLRQHEQNTNSQVVQSTIPIGESSFRYSHAVEIPPRSIPVDNFGLQASHGMMQTNSHVPTFTLQDATTVGFTSLPSQVPEDVTAASHPIGNLGQVPHEMLHTNSGVPAHTFENEASTGFETLQSQFPEDVDYSVGQETIIPLLPHQFFENTTHQEDWDTTLSEELGDAHKGFVASSADILLESQPLKEQFNGDILVEAPDVVSSLPLQSRTTNIYSSVDGGSYAESKDTEWIRKKSERGKAVEMNAITDATLSNVSVSCPIMEDAELHQKKEAVSSFPSEWDLGDFVHWNDKQGFQEASAQSKFTEEDDISWGLPDQANQEVTQTDIPSVGNFYSQVSRPPPVKGSLVGITNWKKTSNSGPHINSHSSVRAPSQSSRKGRKGAIDKHSEAMEFKAWCESEIMRLTGSTDTTILEFCLKQPTSEAEMLLKDNLASFDPEHRFIDTFLNHKELLSPDVLEMAFQPHNDLWPSESSNGNINGSVTGSMDADPWVVAGHGGSKGGQKKKVRKGRR